MSRPAFALLLAAVYAGSPPPALQVLRVSPTGDASPAATITVTFDRPVAGSLDRSIDPASIFKIEPAVPGKLEWRDPVTLRLAPASPLQPGTSYTVTISAGFQAMDGSQLREPYRFSFRVTGPKVLTGLPVSSGDHPRFLTPDTKFELLFSAPIDSAVASAVAYLDFPAGCVSPGIIRLIYQRQRPLGEEEPWQYREAGGYERDRGADALRRVVEFKPERRLPYGCGGDLVVRSIIDEEGTSPYLRWSFRTYGPFELTKAECAGAKFCPSGGIRLHFTTPVRGAVLVQKIHLYPQTPFTVPDTTDELADWYLEAQLKPVTSYAVVADTNLTDVFGQRITGNPANGFTTTSFAPTVEHTWGRMTIERGAFRTLAIRYVNVDTLDAVVAPVPDSLEAKVLQYSRWGGDRDSVLTRIAASVPTRRIVVPGPRDRARIYGLKVPVLNAQRARSPALQLVRVTSPSLDSAWNNAQPWAIVQVTDLGVHARIGAREGVVWVTGLSDGKPRGGATVTLRDTRGAVRATATTNADGVARFPSFRPDTVPDQEGRWRYTPFEGYVSAQLGNDRAVTAISQYDPDLSPWQFKVRSAYGEERLPTAGAVFTERGIYRPGEPLYAKAIVRDGILGALKAPAGSESVRWIFSDRESGTLKDTTVRLSRFGTADLTFRLPPGMPLGQYEIKIQRKTHGAWLDLASTGYRVAEYRPPEFLVDMTGDTAARFPGDSLVATVQARYLFGAPMGRAALSWTLTQTTLFGSEVSIPNTQDYYLGDNGWWWEDSDNAPGGTRVLESGKDTLDPAGRAVLKVGLDAPPTGRPARADLEVTVTDVNRQTVSTSVSTLVHPAAFYLAAKPLGTEYFWTAGTSQSIAVLAVRPNGERVRNVRINGAIIRREWHQVNRDRDGYAETVGDWVSDTVARCGLTSAADPVNCVFTPSLAGSYIASFTATDAQGRAVSTSFYRWATGKDWVPWSDESQFKMDVIPDRSRYTVGDTATVLFASPFTNAEAWITVEREGLIEQRRLRIDAGSTTLKFPITEAYTPNAYVSIIVARGRSAKPGPLDDPGRPTIRVGYAELRVTPEAKRLAVTVEPLSREYRPGDTARVRLRVKDRAGAGQRSEVTLWAVDEGVLALTGYRTPDPIDLIYRERGLGFRLASNVTTVAPQVPEGEKGRSPGGGGGAGQSDILRSRFQTTAFFLGSVVTDSAGNAVARARLPDNLTTFRVMAVALTAGDRYGNGESSVIVTRPLLARPALPRFLRDGDQFSAGVVVNQRSGGTPTVAVTAEAEGAALTGPASQSVTLEAGRGREVRFDLRGQAADTATFRFRVSSAKDADAVQQRIPYQPVFHPRATTIAGVLTDTASVQFTLPEGIDARRSRLALSLGSSPLSVIRGIDRELEVYPWGCTEQVVSSVTPILALYRAQSSLKTTLLRGNPKREIATAVGIILGRQRPDGGIGYWSSSDWTTPWLSAYAGLVLLDAKEAGIAVNDSAVARLVTYLRGALKDPQPIRAPVIGWYDELRVKLSDRVAAVDFLSRAKRADVAAENDLLGVAPQMGWEDRVRLAEVLSRRGAAKAARGLLTPIWNAVKVEGRRAVVADTAAPSYHYFPSRTRPIARLLTATLAVDSAHPLLGPLVETLIQQGRATSWIWWNTQDYAAVVSGLAAFERRQQGAAARDVRVTSGSRLVFGVSGSAGRDSVVSLEGLLNEGSGGATVPLSLTAGSAGGPIYYYLTVSEVPRARPVTPDQEGIQVERWYERYEGGSPTVTALEGDLVRVRLRITVPSDRQFVVLEDPLPAGLEAVDLSLRTVGGLPGPGTGEQTRYQGDEEDLEEEGGGEFGWYYGSWDFGWWSPFDHRELRDDRVVYFATVLWKGTYNASYVARATTPGTFVRPPAHAEEMYNPALHGRSDGGVFTVTGKR